MANDAKEVDDILVSVGLGKWQIRQYALVMIQNITWATSVLGIIVLGFIPDFACLPPDYNSTVRNNLTSATPLNLTYGQSCEWYDDVTNTTEACTAGYVYAEPKMASIVSEWDLICGWTFLADLAQTILIAGISVGTIIFTPIADKYGRRPTIMGCQVVFLITGVLNCLAMNIASFIVVRFFLGAFLGAAGMVVWVLLLEMFPPNHRTLAALITNIFWGVIVTLVPGIGYLMKGLSWRYVQLAMMTFALVVVGQYVYFDESVRWLVANNRNKEIVKVIKRAAKANGISLDKLTSILVRYQENAEDKDVNKRLMGQTTTSENHVMIAQDSVDSTTRVSPRNLLTHPKLRKISLVMALAWFTNSLTYIGLFMMTASMSGDRYMNLFLSAVVEIPSGIILVPIVLRCGRRKVLVVLHLLAAVSLVSAAVLRLTTDGYVANIVFTGAVMLGKFSISSSFNVVYLYTPELYPTNIRSFATGALSVASRVGSLLSPFIASVARHIPWLPAAVFGGLCLVVACLCPLLPETLNKDLPQTLADLDKLFPSEKPRRETGLNLQNVNSSAA